MVILKSGYLHSGSRKTRQISRLGHAMWWLKAMQCDGRRPYSVMAKGYAVWWAKAMQCDGRRLCSVMAEGYAVWWSKAMQCMAKGHAMWWPKAMQCDGRRPCGRRPLPASYVHLTKPRKRTKENYIQQISQKVVNVRLLFTLACFDHRPWTLKSNIRVIGSS